MLKKSRGFTIVELLVVIAIIGFLTTISVVSYLAIQANSRDSQRSSKITILAEALEKYYNQNGEYPSCAAMAAPANTIASSTLKGVDPNILSTPSAANGTNSILAACAGLTTGTDAIAYIGDTSAACTTTNCLQYTLQYREESTGEIKSVASRHKTEVSTSGNITNLSATPVSFTQININWGLVSNAVDYTVQFATNDTFSRGLVENNYTNNSTSITNLIVGTKYYFRVTPNSINGPGNWSNIASATTLSLATPVATATANSFTQITLDWNDISLATSYTVQMSTASNFSSPTITSGITGSTKVFTGLEVGTMYYFRVQAVATGDISDWSGAKNMATLSLATPVATATANSFTQITLDWNDISLATSYTVQMSTASNFSSPTITSGITGSTKVFTNLTPGTAYYFRVQALATGDTSDWSGAKNTTTPALATPIVIVTYNSITQTTLDWNDISLATSYTVQMSTSSSFTSPTIVSGITGSTKTFTGLTAGTTYYFRVQAVATGDTSDWSKTASLTTLSLTTPIIATTTANSFTQITLDWNDVPLAASYTVQMSTASNFSSPTITSGITGSTKVFAGLIPGTKYYFRVQAVATGDTSDWSGSKYATTPALATPTLTATANSFNQVTLVWNDISLATSYTIQRSTSSSFTSPTIVSGITANTKVITGLIAGTTYYFRVQAVATGDTSDWSGSNATTPALATPTATATANSPTQITLDWNDISLATSYTAQMSTSKSFTSPTIVSGITGSTKVFTGLAPGTVYYFHVQAVATGDTSDWSLTVSDNTYYSMTATSSITNLTNSFPATVAYNSVGYTGTLAKNGSSFVSSGAYTPTDTQSITISYGAFTIEDWCYWTGAFMSFYNDTGWPAATRAYNSGGYTGTLNLSAYETSGVLTQYAYWDWDKVNLGTNPISSPTYNTKHHYYQGSYVGSVTRPASDTRHYTQNYSGTVIKP